MLKLFRNATGAAIFGYVFAAVLFGQARAAEKPQCVDLKKGINEIFKSVNERGLQVWPVSPDKMAEFVDLMKNRGIAISGDAALVVGRGPHQLAIYVRRKDKLCFAFAGDLNPPTPQPGSQEDPNRAKAPVGADGRGWI